MYCPTHKTKMTQLFTSWVCDACSPVASEAPPQLPQYNSHVVIKNSTFSYQPDMRDCFGDFLGAAQCIRCPHKAACLDKTADGTY